MNTHIIISTSILSRFLRFISAMLVVALTMPSFTFSQSPDPVDIGSAAAFGVLAAAGITNAGATRITGDIGSYPTATITGFPPGSCTGTIHAGDATANTAMVDLHAGYLNAAARSVTATIGTELGTTTLTHGVYNSAAGTFTLTGTLTLSGTSSDVFIFKMGTTLTTAVSSSVILDGVLWTNIFWQVGSSATLGGSSVFEGNILANTSITSGDGATVHGRLLAGAVTQTGTVSLTNNTALPVELISFTAVLNNKMVKLYWSTATEINNYGFEIERASSSTTPVRHWNRIGFMEGHGNSNSPKEYFFEDKNPKVGKLHYRLKQVDTDGGFEYSEIVDVEVAELKRIAISQNYPNPFNPTTSFSYEIQIKSHVVIKVYNVLGKQVAELLNGEKLPGRYQIEFDAPHLPSGVYFYTINSGSYKPIIKKMVLLK